MYEYTCTFARASDVRAWNAPLCFMRAQRLRLRAALRSFDPLGRAAAEGDVLQNLLAVDWSTFFARDVLQENPRSLQRLRNLFGRDTVAAKELIAAYEPALLSTVQHMMRLQGPPGRPPGQNGPLHFCGTFGWSQVAAELTSIPKARVSLLGPGDHGLRPSACAAAAGHWRLARRLRSHEDEADEAEADAQLKYENSENSENSEHSGPLLLPSPASPASPDWAELLDATSAIPPATSRHLPPCQSCVLLGHLRLSLPEVHLDLPAVLPIPCVERNISFAEFMQYFRTKRPFLIRKGLAVSASARALLDALDRSDLDGAVGSIPYAHDFMPRVARQADGLQEVLQGHAYLFLEIERETRLEELVQTYGLFGMRSWFNFDQELHSVLQVSLGQSGTGAPWHWHQDAFNVCLAGERAWFLKPPAEALMSRRPVSQGLPHLAGSYFAKQRHGDVLYVPELWSHAVVNLMLSSSLAFEFGTGSQPEK
ncbi:unnamed protein product [Effrenium voratum]|uniref:JmjC domain-containing protein n=1 Tax=Effrenium voratum TaxID=2562239 RepID=A0AA36N376_9DINO|nr:unnamed protein product [Effrenium voratum]